MEYQLGETNVHKYLDKLLGNLAYGIETGRKAALDCLQQIINQFPDRIIAPKVKANKTLYTPYVFFTTISEIFRHLF